MYWNFQEILTKDPSSAWGCDTFGNIPPCGVALRRTCRCTEFHCVKNANLRHPSAMRQLLSEPNCRVLDLTYRSTGEYCVSSTVTTNITTSTKSVSDQTTKSVGRLTGEYCHYWFWSKPLYGTESLHQCIVISLGNLYPNLQILFLQFVVYQEYTTPQLFASGLAYCWLHISSTIWPFCNIIGTL